MNQRGIVYLYMLLGVIVLVLIGGGAYYLGTKQSQSQQPTASSLVGQVTQSPSSDLTVNWSTYTNPTFNYSIRYPGGYSVPSQTARQVSQLGKDSVMCITRLTDQVCIIPIYGYTNPNNLSLINWATSHKHLFNPSNATATKINSYNALFLNDPTQTTYTDYLISSGINIIQLNIPNTEEGKQIISTFTFINQNQTSGVTNTSS